MKDNLFKKIVIGLIIAFVLFTFMTRKRTGAVCEDGWESSATGSGACSHHGGVDNWKYKYWWE